MHINLNFCAHVQSFSYLKKMFKIYKLWCPNSLKWHSPSTYLTILHGSSELEDTICTKCTQWTALKCEHTHTKLPIHAASYYLIYTREDTLQLKRLTNYSIDIEQQFVLFHNIRYIYIYNLFLYIDNYIYKVICIFI